MINRAVGRQVLLFCMAVVVIYMGAGFVRQTLVGRQQREVLRGIVSQIGTETQEQASLQAQLEHGLSPQAAEEWAHQNGLARPDEQLVIVVAPPGEPASGEEVEALAGPPAPESLRQTWWDLFFADR
ncbi:MAG: hypothetical protein JXA93_26060 [Anaerolineae bacterium]|nr:hypothetical protein [Anaerolineae bacterium]